MLRQGAILSVLLALEGCLVTADESLWKSLADAGRSDRAADLGRDRPQVADAGRDLARRDFPRTDAAGVDARLADRGLPDLACGQASLKVLSAADDGEVDGSAQLMRDGEPAGIYVGFWNDGGPRSVWGYFRFTVTATIPKSATLTSAALTLHGIGTDQWDPTAMALEVLVELSPDAPQVAAAHESPFGGAGSRTVTQTAVRWPATSGLSWAAGSNTSPSLVKPIQEVVSTFGLAAGSHLQLWVRGAQTLTGEVMTLDYKQPGYPMNGAKLELGWCK